MKLYTTSRIRRRSLRRRCPLQVRRHVRLGGLYRLLERRAGRARGGKVVRLPGQATRRQLRVGLGRGTATNHGCTGKVGLNRLGRMHKKKDTR